MAKLDDALYSRILEMTKIAEGKQTVGACKDAARIYLEALEMLPKPIEQWEAATWLSGRAADALFLDRQYAAALDELRRTLRLPDAVSNPFIWLRHGQSLYEQGNMAESQQSLLKAYMLGGEDVFEDEHPKYLNAIKNLI